MKERVKCVLLRLSLEFGPDKQVAQRRRRRPPNHQASSRIIQESALTEGLMFSVPLEVSTVDVAGTAPAGF